MSNPELPGPYWQDQGGVGYGAGPRGGFGGPQGADSPWDDGAGFWRDDRASTRDSRDSRDGRGGGDADQRSAGRRSEGRHSEGRRSEGRRSEGKDARYENGAQASSGRGSRRADGSRADGPPAAQGNSWQDMLAGRSRHASPRRSERGSQAADDWAGDGATGRSGRFSQTADDLRSRLGIRSAGAGRDEAGAAGSSADQARGGWAGGRAAGRETGRAAARAGGLRSSAGDYGDYGDYSDNGPGGGRSRTALHDHPDEYWSDDDRPGRNGRSRITDRPGIRHGGNGDGSNGHGGNGHGGGSGGGRGGGRGGRAGRDGGPRSRSERFTDWLLYGDWWRRWTLKKALLVLCGAFAAFVLLAIIGIAVLYSMTPIPTDVTADATWQSSSVYFGNGQLLGTFTNSQDINRQLLTTSQIPQNVNDAIIAAEDRNFYHEGGISVSGIARAAKDDLFGSGGLQGGSTITE
ncbi:MAG TPA: transglycosylase domain-containing protein, partial [Streptosporangiaceae bacterium]|nr:transglycosylase domain-containing protein [Streptosporangiaceae bacterium]